MAPPAKIVLILLSIRTEKTNGVDPHATVRKLESFGSIVTRVSHSFDPPLFPLVLAIVWNESAVFESDRPNSSDSSFFPTKRLHYFGDGFWMGLSLSLASLKAVPVRILCPS